MPFEKGQSGNPSGRPKSRPFKTALAMELAEVGADHKALREIASRLIEAARGGDMQAINALVDRTDGKPDRTLNLELSKKLSEIDPSKAIAQIADLVTVGELSPDEGVKLTGIIESRIKAIEIVELESRLKALETKV